MVRAVEGPEPAFRCSEIRQRGPCAAAREDCHRPCQIAAAFAKAEAAWREVLQTATIAGLAAEASSGFSSTHIQDILAWFGANVTELPGG